MNGLMIILPYLSAGPPLAFAAASRASRQSATAARGLRIGDVTVQGFPGSLALTAGKGGVDATAEWWNPEGDLRICFSDTDPDAMHSTLEKIKSSWRLCRVTELAVQFTEEPDTPLCLSSSTFAHSALENIRVLKVDHLNMDSFEPGVVLDRLQELYLYCATGCLRNVLHFAPNLEYLSVDNGQLCGMSSRELAEFRGRRLEVANTALAFDALQAPENMEFLSLTGVKLVNFSWEGFTKLSTVFLARTSLESLDELCKCKNLSTVNLWGCASVTTVAGVSQLWNLKELFLQETSITDKGIDELKKCTQLEKLNMGGCVNLTNVNCLGTLVSLEELHLWSTKVVNSGIIGLGNCVSLVELVLDDCKKISDVNCLSGLRRLRYLSVIGTSVNSEGIRHLLRCPKLECLSICGAEIHHAPKLWNHESVVAFLSTL